MKFLGNFQSAHRSLITSGLRSCQQLDPVVLPVPLCFETVHSLQSTLIYLADCEPMATILILVAVMMEINKSSRNIVHQMFKRIIKIKKQRKVLHGYDA